MSQEEPIDRTSRWCVIGAGPAGLLAARSLKRAGIPYDQLERDGDVGGIWDIDKDWSPMYETAHFISSKTVSHLPGYPMPDSYPDYPNHRQILAYLRRFAEDEGLQANIEFGCPVERAEREGDTWIVTVNGTPRRYRGLFVCSGNTWDPNLPSYPGTFDGEAFHSVRYRSPDVFRGRRVLIVGGGNSGCDIACDAATHADAAWISLRRGYHFIPKHIFGIPSDKFAEGVQLPGWLERVVFSWLLKIVVGDLTKYGLPEPDHRPLEAHPIVNSKILGHLRDGELRYVPDIERFDGHTVHLTNAPPIDVDLIVFATGYNVTFPFLDRSHFRWRGKYPELYLSALHRDYDNLCVLGLHQTDGGAYRFFGRQADMMCNFILDQVNNPARAEEFTALKKTDDPDLSGGLRYVKSDRHATYVKKSEFERYTARLMKRLSWTRFSEL